MNKIILFCLITLTIFTIFNSNHKNKSPLQSYRENESTKGISKVNVGKVEIPAGDKVFSLEVENFDLFQKFTKKYEKWDIKQINKELAFYHNKIQFDQVNLPLEEISRDLIRMNALNVLKVKQTLSEI
jgi:hypothetical protein